MNGAALLVGALGLAALAPVHGQDYPSKPVRIIVPLAPGGLGDQLTRVVAAKLPPATKQPVIVENRTGGGGIIGAEAAARAAPDGYTLFTGLHNTQAILPHLYAKLPYDPVKDFLPVVMMGTAPNVLVIHPSLPAKSVKELVALARARKGDLTYASQGVGSSGHIAAELFKLTAKVDIVHVPYKGAAPANQDLMGGHVMMMFDIAPFALPNMRAGKVRALAVATPERLPIAPSCPRWRRPACRKCRGAPGSRCLRRREHPVPSSTGGTARRGGCFPSATPASGLNRKERFFPGARPRPLLPSSPRIRSAGAASSAPPA
jgi:tripartite-type tricarboxylate transporter receptor subunit TctC